MRKLTIVIAMALLGLGSCYYDNGEDLYPVDPDNCKTDSLTYDNQIGTLINLTCSSRGCHYSGNQPPSLTNYSEVIANLDRIEVRALQERSMPPSGPLSQCQHNQLTQWIADGAPEK